MTLSRISFPFVVAGILAVVTVPVVFLFNWVFVKIFALPIEMLAVIVFLSRTAPCVFALGVPYALGARWLFSRSGRMAPRRQYFMVVGTGFILTTLIVGIVFPCDLSPFYVGGYLVRHLIESSR